ncbi:hypothetical protein ACFYOV_02800 [Streptomyces sp. NPDC005931]|uniref:hypothetical protein n=1 Tax=Streptomyces sp. NPDC005931 TaxID=3364737 RepID=UPI0036A7B3E8
MIVLLVAVGSPWVQRPLFDHYVEHYYDGETQRWLLQAAFLPAWDLSPDYYGGVGHLIANIGAVALLFGGIVLLPSWLPGLLPRWVRCAVAGVLVSECVNLMTWAVPELFRPGADEFRYSGEALKAMTRAALFFGLAAGLLFALLTAVLAAGSSAGSTGSRAATSVDAATASFRRRSKGELGMTTAPVHMPVGSTPGDVTRYLCAAAYVDERFADRVLEDVLADEASAVAPSPGVDLVAVVRHCLTAREMRHRRDLRLTAAFAVVALVAPLWLIASLAFLGVTGRTGPQPTLATRGRPHPGRKVLVGAGVAAGLMLLLAFALGAAVSALPAPGPVSWLLGAYLGGVPAVLASAGAAAWAYATVVRHDLDVDRLLRTTMTREAFARQPRPTVPRRRWVADRLAAIREAQDGNVTVYSGYTPWIGYAATDAKWSLTVPLLPADDPAGGRGRPAVPRPFEVTELVGHVRRRLQGVAAGGMTDGPAGSGEEALATLVVEDRVFASGTTVGDDERFIRPTSLAPAARLSAEAVEQIMLRPTGTVRHCLAIHVPMWGGDVVPSVFLHVSTAGRSLHLHLDIHVLGPVRAAYHVVDRLHGPLTPEARRGQLAEALRHTGRAFAGAPFRARRQARFESRHNRRMMDELRAVEQDPVYDFGARVSVRELALSPNYHNYFQVVDAERITALVQRHTFAAVRAFLDAHGYDTTDFRAQQQTILNQGVIQQGGTSIIGNQAIGAGATATQTVPRQSGAARPAAAGGGGSDK